MKPALAFGFLLYASLDPVYTQLWNSLGARLLATIGIFSFSLYATHSPVLLLFHSLIDKGDVSYKHATLWPALGGTCIALLFAYIFFLLIESWSITEAKPGKSQRASTPES